MAIDAIAKRLAPLIRLLKNSYPIVIIFDREDRRQTCKELRELLVGELGKLGIKQNGILISVADRMIENWILACPDIRKKYAIDRNTEGCNGKVHLKQLLDMVDQVYDETTIGVDLFCAIKVKEVAKNGESFEAFLAATKDHCAWLRKATIT